MPRNFYSVKAPNTRPAPAKWNSMDVRAVNERVVRQIIRAGNERVVRQAVRAVEGQVLGQ